MSTADSNPILLGTAFRTINPPPGWKLVGYPNPQNRANTGVGTDLCARVAIFGLPRAESPLAAIVVVDTLTVTAKLVKHIRDAATQRVKGLDPESVFVAATHTHSAPASEQLGSAFWDGDAQALQENWDNITEGAASALAEAWKERAEGFLRVGRTELRMGHNRRVLNTQGIATNVWEDGEGKHPGFFNPNVRFLVFENATTRKPQAVIALYGCHPVTLGPGNTKASADYPGYFVRALQTALPGCFAMHLTGAAADINPRLGLAETPEKAQQLGNALANVVLAEIPFARPLCCAPISTHIEKMLLPLGPNAIENYSRRAADSTDGKTIHADIQVVRIGDVAFVSAPGELFAQTGLAMENASPFAATFVVNCSNDSLGYLVTEAVLREGGYEARNAISHEFEPCILAASRAALDKVFAA